MDIQKVKGMWLGLIMGDALGMPHDFSRKQDHGLSEYSDKLVTTTYHNQWQGSRSTALGQGSDDSEMALALWDCIQQNGGKYYRDKVTLRYMEFAAHSSFLGKNTTLLFKGVKTLRGYEGRRMKIFGDQAEDTSQSNGSLMRIAPLALCEPHDIESTIMLVTEDTSLTNPNSVNLALGFAYVVVMQYLVRPKPQDKTCLDVISYALGIAERQWPLAQEAIRTILNPQEADRHIQEIPDVRGNSKGWIRHAAHIAFDALLKAERSWYLQNID